MALAVHTCLVVEWSEWGVSVYDQNGLFVPPFFLSSCFVLVVSYLAFLLV